MVRLVAPIQAIIFVVAFLWCYSFWSAAWFSYHPMFMILGYLGFMSNAIFFERWGVDHWTHMILQLICVTCTDFAWYVIYTNKNMAKKNHNTSWHSWIGVACLVLNNIQCISSMYSLWPNKSRKDIKPIDITLHKWGGRIMFIAILVTMHMGFYKMRSMKIMQVILFDVFLASVAIISLTKFVYIRSLWSKIKI